MNTSPDAKLAQLELSSDAVEQIEAAVAGGLGELTVRELLGLTLSRVAHAERSAYLRKTPDDKANGAYARHVAVGSINVPFEVPRTRNSAFRPAILPPAYQRGYSETTRDLLLALLTSSRSLNAAKAAVKNLGLPLCADDLEQVASEFLEDFRLRNTRPLSPDLIALFVDGKYVEVRDGDQIRPATIYVAVGLDRDGHKRILACLVRPGRENLDDWKRLLRGLLDRGLRRVLIVVQDDFSGLLKITQSLFPNADVQLCIVHMQRNAKSHFPKAEAAVFLDRIRSIKAGWSTARAAAEFDDLCNDLESAAPHFIAELRKKRDHYLCFIDYPAIIRKSLSTTNAVEAVNGQLERLRRNNGGYFQSDSDLDLKLGIAIQFLENGKWRSPAAAARAALDQLNSMFERRFEHDS